MSRTPEYLVADLELWADRIADGHIFHTPDELNCAAVMRLAAMMLKSPQRTWVDLTDDEMWNAYTGGSNIVNLDYAKTLLAKAKEKNT
jgi:hypothetical protein